MSYGRLLKWLYYIESPQEGVEYIQRSANKKIQGMCVGLIPYIINAVEDTITPRIIGAVSLQERLGVFSQGGISEKVRFVNLNTLKGEI